MANVPAVIRSRAVTGTTSGHLQVRQETKADRFKRLANARVAVALEAIERLGNLGTANYEYTNAEVDKLRLALDRATGRMANRLLARKPATQSKQSVL